MRHTLVALHRVRHTVERGARLEFAGAERARLEQEGWVEAIHEQVAQSRSGDSDGYVAGDACWLAHEQGFRLRKQVELRRESSHLQLCTTEVENRRGSLREALRDTRVVELALEHLDAEQDQLRRRADARRMDGIAAERWWRRQAS